MLRPKHTLNLIGWLAVFGCLVAFSGCGAGRSDAGIPPDVQQFVASQGLPQVREIRTVLAVPEEDLLFFSVKYGEPQDCASGCFYVRGWGLRYNGRIGWLHVDIGSSHVDRARLIDFEIGPSDRYLFSESLLERLRANGGANGLGYISSTLRMLLATDSDTPDEALLMIARRLSREGWPYLGYLMFEAARARSNREVLETLANLGESYWDFSDVRARARAALGEISGG